MAPLKALKDIPTIAYLYRTKAIRPTSKDLPPGNQEYNDKVCTVQYDLTKLQVDAIVNAANARLLGGGGVDGAIHTAAGPGLLEECRTLGGCKTGSAKITDAYNLPCKKVIHAVGPIFKDEETSEPLLRGCYRTALQLAVDNDCRSIAFSAISTGIYGYPSPQAAKAALREVMTFLRRPEGKKLDKIVFCSFLDKDVKAYAAAIPEVFGPTEEDLSEAVSPILEAKQTVEKISIHDERLGDLLIQASRTAWSSAVAKSDGDGFEKALREPITFDPAKWTTRQYRQEDHHCEPEIVEIQLAGEAQEMVEHPVSGERSIGAEHRVDDATSAIPTSGTLLDTNPTSNGIRHEAEPSENNTIRADTCVSNDFSTRANALALPNSSEEGSKDIPQLTEDDSDGPEDKSESESAEWRGYGARSRSCSDIGLNNDFDTDETRVGINRKRLDMNTCKHDLVHNESLHLWPMGRMRCSKCGCFLKPNDIL